MTSGEVISMVGQPISPSIESHAQPQARAPHAVADAVRHRDRRPLPRAWHRLERRDLLDLPSHAAPGPRRPAAGAAGELWSAGTEEWLSVVRPGGELRGGVQLPDVPRPAARASRG